MQFYLCSKEAVSSIPALGFWAGVTDIQTEGAYLLSDGTTPQWTSFQPTQPDGAARSTEDCVIVSNQFDNYWAWHDADCNGDEFYYMCSGAQAMFMSASYGKLP